MEGDDQPQLKQEERKAAFKKGVDVEEGRRKREDALLDVRKSKREEQMMKRRKDIMGDMSESTPIGGPGIQAFGMQSQMPGVSGAARVDTTMQSKLANLPQWRMMIFSDDLQAQLEGTQQFRKILSIGTFGLQMKIVLILTERNPPIQPVIDQGVIPRLVEFLLLNDRPKLQFEAAWAITNIASGTPEQTGIVIRSGAVPILVRLLQAPAEEVREQAVWALGNIAGDSPLCRDFVLSQGALAPLLNILMESKTITMVRNATWTLSNFCRGKPQPELTVVRAALPILKRLITSADEEVLTDACWALSYLSDGPNDRIQAVIEAGVVRRMVDFLIHPNPAVQTPALRTVGNIVTGDDQQTQEAISCGCLQYLLSLIASPRKSIRKEACWTISNITAGSKAQIEAVIRTGIFPPLINVMRTADFDVKKEAAWAISNATSGGTPEQIDYLVREGCIKPLCDLLTVHDNKIVLVALEGLENILNSGRMPDGSNRYSQQVEEYGAENLNQLSDHGSDQIYKKALDLAERFLTPADQVQGFQAAPPSGTQFGFGMPAQFSFGAPQQPFGGQMGGFGGQQMQ